jgi:hypothetical protein
LSQSQFQQTIHLLNSALVKSSPPLLNLRWWRSGIVSIWVLIAALSAIVWHYTGSVMIIAVEPAIMVLSSMIFMMIYYRKAYAFEVTIEEICDCLNATENVRGIRYALHKSRLSNTNSTLKWVAGDVASYVGII